jgi:hypothetical protein
VRCLGDVGVLAEKALEVASNGCDGKTTRSGLKVIQGLLFDGVDVLSDESPIHQRVENSPIVLANTALASIPRFDAALMAAEKAMHLLIVKLFVEQGLFHVSHLPENEVDLSKAFSDNSPQ